MLHRKRSITAALILVVFAGCSSASDARSSELTRPLPTQFPIASAGLRLPLDQFKLSYTDAQESQAAAARYLGGCMKSRGASATISGDFVRPDEDSRLAWGGLFGTMPRDHATAFGYHAAPESAFSLSGGFYIRSYQNLSVASADMDVIANFYGPENVPSLPEEDRDKYRSKGCLELLNEATETSFGDFSDVEGDLMNLTYNDSRVQTAMAAWSSCMAGKGYNFDGVDAASASLSALPLSKQERETAAADVDCTAESGWANLYYAILSDYQSQAIDIEPDRYRDVLRSQEQWRDAVLSLQ